MCYHFSYISFLCVPCAVLKHSGLISAKHIALASLPIGFWLIWLLRLPGRGLAQGGGKKTECASPFLALTSVSGGGCRSAGPVPPGQPYPWRPQFGGKKNKQLLNSGKTASSFCPFSPGGTGNILLLLISDFTICFLPSLSSHRCKQFPMLNHFY